MVKIATLAKPVALQTKNLTKEEREAREEAEEKLKGSDSYIQDECIPDCLTKQERKYYIFILSEMKKLEILQNIDILTMIHICRSLGFMEQCVISMRREGMVDESGKESAYNKIYNGHLKNVDSLSKQLCLTVSSRAGLSKMLTEASEKEDDILLKILSE